VNSLEKPFKKSDEVELEVGKLAFGGKGVARVKGYVIFVEGAVPGDRVKALITKAKPSYAEARVKEFLSQSASRVKPKCRHFSICGGCAWQSLSYEEQLKYKQQQVIECLEHIGGMTGFTVEDPVDAEPLWRYRNKVEFSFAGGENGIELGFHPPGEWRRVIGIEDCLLHSEVSNRVRNFVRDYARSSGAGAFEQRPLRGFWRNLVIREGKNTGEIMINVITSSGDFPGRNDFIAALRGSFPEIVSMVWSINETPAAATGGLPYKVLFGRDYIFEEICGIRLKVSPSSFLQTNTLMAERLYRRAREYAALKGDELVLDLYCGIGSIALFFAGASSRVLGIEIMEEAARLAGENARLNAVINTVFIAGKVRKALKDIGLEKAPDLIVLDPPRAGLGKKEIERVAALAPPRIVYVSCNAATMAGNARQLAESGYRLVKTGAVDMFPQTPHIESVSLLTRD
jgi:23S rRNA (uracil1939-C5)-methyltransferase